MQFQFLRDPSNGMIPHQNKNFGPFSAKTSLTFLTQSWRGRVGGGGGGGVHARENGKINLVGQKDNAPLNWILSPNIG